MTLHVFMQIWLIGCFLSFMALKLCDIMTKGKGKLQPQAFWMGVSFSWLVVIYFTVLMIRGYRLHKKSVAIFAKLSDSAMIKTTIDEYWVPATMYGEEFDPDPCLPIKDSPLCKVYYDTPDKVLDRFQVHCRMCPIHKASFGCTAVGFYLNYQKSNPGADRKRRAMILGKVFGDIYNEVVRNERNSKRS